METKEIAHAGLTLIEKRLSSRERAIPEAAALLRAEAALLRALGGRVTPRLVDEGDGFFRMERVALPTLEALLVRGALPPDWLERAARAAFATLAELHEATDARGPLGAVHGDPSPANVAVDEEGERVVLLDLGLAVWREAPPRDGAFRGTPAYVAPEVARGETPGVASDLFSVAATLVHAALGTPPRDLGTATLGAVIALAAEQPIVDARVQALAARGPGHAALVACLAHDAADRPSSARAVLALM